LLGERTCPNIEAFQVWSQSLGHEHVATTLTSYGTVSSHRQAEIFDELRRKINMKHPDEAGTPSAIEVARIVSYLQKQAS
jgi:hypothetical protein